MLKLQETNNQLKLNLGDGENAPNLVIRSSHEADMHSTEIIRLLKEENQNLKEDLDHKNRVIDDISFENEQLKIQGNQIGDLYQRIEMLQGSESEMAEMVKK